MNEDVIRIGDMIRILRRNAFVSAVVVVTCIGLSVAAAYLVPPRYKATALLNIQAAYFQIPLVNDLIASVHDPSELRAQRESLLRMALSDEFVDSLADRYGIYEYPAGHRFRAVEREFFLKGIQYFSVAPTTFQISASGSTPEQAQDLTQSVLDRMVSTLISERLSKLTRAKNAIESNLNSLRISLAGAGGPADSSTAAMLREEIRKGEADLIMLQNRFTAEHPTVQEQRRTVEMLQERLTALSSGSRGRRRAGDEDGTAVASGSKKAIQEMYDEFVRKFNYLNVVLEMEKDAGNVPYLSIVEQPDIPARPYFPKKRVFVVVGLALGLVISVIIALFRELRRGTFLTPARASDALGVPLLGILPAWKGPGAKVLIEGYTMSNVPVSISLIPGDEAGAGSGKSENRGG